MPSPSWSAAERSFPLSRGRPLLERLTHVALLQSKKEALGILERMLTRLEAPVRLEERLFVPSCKQRPSQREFRRFIELDRNRYEVPGVQAGVASRLVPRLQSHVHKGDATHIGLCPGPVDHAREDASMRWRVCSMQPVLYEAHLPGTCSSSSLRRVRVSSQRRTLLARSTIAPSTNSCASDFAYRGRSIFKHGSCHKSHTTRLYLGSREDT